MLVFFLVRPDSLCPREMNICFSLSIIWRNILTPICLINQITPLYISNIPCIYITFDSTGPFPDLSHSIHSLSSYITQTFQNVIIQRPSEIIRKLSTFSNVCLDLCQVSLTLFNSKTGRFSNKTQNNITTAWPYYAILNNSSFPLFRRSFYQGPKYPHSLLSTHPLIN